MVSEDIIQKIEKVLHELQPFIEMHNGNISFKTFENGVVTVALQGACSGCALSMYTVKMGIEERLMQEIPEVREVVALNE